MTTSTKGGRRAAPRKTKAVKKASTDLFGPFTTETETQRLVEVQIPPGWKVQVLNGSEFQVRMLPIETESEDEADSQPFSPNQSKSG